MPKTKNGSDRLVEGQVAAMETAYADAASPNASKPNFSQIGKIGLNAFTNTIQQAHIAELRWPSVWPIYSKLFRTDPEVAVMRYIMGMMATQVRFEVSLPEDANDDEMRYRDFVNEVFEDLAGATTFTEKLVTKVPLLGFAWWEVLPAMRLEDWQPPGDETWQSSYDDGLIGIRRFAWRDHSTFSEWKYNDGGMVTHFVQQGPNGEPVAIPADRSLHMTFGDGDNPEGLATLEAMYRIERYKYGLELVQGVGFEHTAGHLNVHADETPDAAAITLIKKAARAILAVQEGNYALWPKGYKADIVSSPFQAAAALQEAIRYYGLVKLQLLNMQFVSIATTSGAGAYAAISDSSEMFVQVFNAMLQGFAEQLDWQVGRRLWQWNKAHFPGVRRRPKLGLSQARKFVDIGKLGDFVTKFAANFPMGDEDIIAIRTHSGILPSALPIEEELEEAPEPEPEEEPDFEPTPEPEDEPEEDAELSVPGVMEQFRAWAKDNAPPVYRLLMLRANDE